MDRKEIVLNAQKALLYEVTTPIKPGLVDPVNHGAHLDMDIYTFIDSSLVLRQYFQQCANLGVKFKGDLPDLFEEIRLKGIEAEKVMFSETKGINTHKGAIFSLGIFVTATAYLSQETTSFDIKKVQEIIKAMLINLLENDFKNLNNKESLTIGEKQYLEYGQTGIRGEAAAGYPSVMLGLEFLRKTTGDRKARILDTLMYLAGKVADSNLVKRANDPQIITWMQAKSKIYFEKGGATSQAGQEYLCELDDIFSQKQYSLGGTADILIITIFCGLMMKIV